jgi:hypothetical protein
MGRCARKTFCLLGFFSAKQGQLSFPKLQKSKQGQLLLVKLFKKQRLDKRALLLQAVLLEND